MSMKREHSILVGKIIKKAAGLRGGGSALPGLVVEKLDKHFLADTLSDLPEGIVLISGTNGKTTTTKVVTELLERSGLKVFTNRTGSNFTRGIVAALISAVNKKGQLDYDIAVLELDEAYATHFVRQVQPDHVLILNVMRDQLDRFGEIDHTARLLETVAKSATKSVVLNSDDPRVAAIATSLKKEILVHYFGTDKNLRNLFLNDDDLHGPPDQKVSSKNFKPANNDVELVSFENNNVSFLIGPKKYDATLKLTGVHNFLNAAGALALCRNIISDKDQSNDELISSLETIAPAFGRGEIFKLHDTTLELVLVKNPAGFRLALSSFTPDNTSCMIAINDQYADGRDMSWLWDVDFTGLKESGVRAVSGVRAYDMALRLQYDEIEVGQVNTDLKETLQYFLKTDKKQPKRIFCTYTAMTQTRRLLKKFVKVERIS